MRYVLQKGVATAVFRGVTVLSSFCVSIILANLVSQSVYGNYQSAIALISLLVLISLLGLPNIIIRELNKPETRAGKEDFVSFVICVILMASAAISLLGWLIASLFLGQFATIFSWLLPLVPILAVGTFLNSYLVANQAEIIAGTVDSLRTLLFAAALYLVGLTAFDLAPEVAIPTIQISTALLGLMAVFLTSWVLKRKSWFSVVKFNIANEVGILRESIPLLFTASLALIQRNADILMVNGIVGAEESGTYHVGARLSSILLFALTAFLVPLRPIIAKKYYASQSRELSITIARFSLFSFLIGLMILSVLLVFGERVIDELYGYKYRDAYLVCITLSVFYLFDTFIGPAAVILSMTGFQKYLLYISIGITAINLVLNLLLIPFYGVLGAALATGISLTAAAVSCKIIIELNIQLATTPIPQITALLRWK